jgi:TonB family protein
LILRDLEKKPENIIGFQELDEPLKPLSRQPPTYPIALLKTMPAGDAVVKFFVDVNGNVQLPHIKSSSAPEFGYAAVQAVAAWRFEVPKKGGKVVVVRAEVPVGFEGRKADGAQKP